MKNIIALLVLGLSVFSLSAQERISLWLQAELEIVYPEAQSNNISIGPEGFLMDILYGIPEGCYHDLRRIAGVNFPFRPDNEPNTRTMLDACMDIPIYSNAAYVKNISPSHTPMLERVTKMVWFVGM